MSNPAAPANGTPAHPLPLYPGLPSSSSPLLGKHLMVQKTTFIQKLHKILEEDDYQHLIRWSPSGTSFLVLDSAEFSRNVLPKVFKHNNYTSFVRQLNLYGFHKKNRSYHRHAGMTDAEREAEPREFSHPKFIRYRPDLLAEIRRKSALEKYPMAGGPANNGSSNGSNSNNHSNGRNSFPTAADELHAAATLAGVANATAAAASSSRNLTPSMAALAVADTRRGASPAPGGPPRSPLSPTATARSPPFNTLPPPSGYPHSSSSSAGNHHRTPHHHHHHQSSSYSLPPPPPAPSAHAHPGSGPSTLTMMQDVQSMMMKQLSHLQTNVQDLMAELRDVRKQQDLQQRVIESLVRDVRLGPERRSEPVMLAPPPSVGPPPPAVAPPIAPPPQPASHHHRHHHPHPFGPPHPADDHYHVYQQRERERDREMDRERERDREREQRDRERERERERGGDRYAYHHAAPGSPAQPATAAPVTSSSAGPSTSTMLPPPSALASFSPPTTATTTTVSTAAEPPTASTSPYASPPVDTDRIHDSDRRRTVSPDAVAQRFHPYGHHSGAYHHGHHHRTSKQEEEKPRFILPPPRGQEEWGQGRAVGWR